MNIAVIFAGGVGQRMNAGIKPKQFLELHGKPIIIHTIEHFEEHEEIDGIVLVCLDSWINYLEKLLVKFSITKVKSIVPGGETGQLSIYNGLKKAGELYDDDSIVLIHDGVRPIINGDLISRNINSVKNKGNAITVSAAIETITIKTEKSEEVGEIIDRSKCQLAKAPQSFYLKDIIAAHEKALSINKTDYIDSACIMRDSGKTLYTVECQPDNIKITTPLDFYTFRAIVDAKENSQIFG